MLKKRGVSWVLALALALVGAVVVQPTTAAAAVTITVSASQNVQAQMATHYGSTTSSASGGTANYQSTDCLRLGSATAGTTGTITNPSGQRVTSATNGYTAYRASGFTVWAAHGRAGNNCPDTNNLDLSGQSALGFSPASVSTLTPTTLFNLGQVIHRNTGIYLTSGNEYFRGKLNLQFMGMALSYNYEIHETTGNNAADTTTFLNQISDQTFVYDGITYTLIVRGFTAPQSGTTCNATVPSLNSVTTTFTTPESSVTQGCLYAQVQQVRTLKIQKQVVAPYGAPAAYPASSFTAGSDVAGSPWAGNFSLTPTGTGAAGQAVKEASLVTGQTINIAEVAPTGAGWAFTGLSCVDGSGSSSIPGLTVSGAGIALTGDYSTSSATAAPITCTYTNTYTPRATLTLVKNVTTNGQPAPQAQPADWTLSATGTGALNGQGVSGRSGSSAVTGASVIAGTYSLAEVASNPATTSGYVQDGGWSCTGGTLNGSTLTLAAGQNATCAVRNKFAVGRLAITKTVTGDGYTAGAGRAFSADYACTSGSTTVKSGRVTVHPGATNGTAGAAVVVDNVPAGLTCAVTEAEPPTGSTPDLADTSWVWGTPTNPAPVKIVADATATVNITNSTSRQFGSFQIAKAISPRSGVPGAGYSGGADRSFPISYECKLGATTVSSGTVDVSTGASKTISGLPASSTCAVTGEELAAASGDFTDASYAWDGHTTSSPVTITADSTATVSVTNHFRRDLVTLNLAKVVTGNGYAGSGKAFHIDYDCGEPYRGSVSVAAGGSASVTVPSGVACAVAERTPSDELLKSGYVWDAPTYAGLTDGSVTMPAAGATVTVTNPTSIGYGRLQVEKAIASHGDQVTSGTGFDVRVTCDRPAQGSSGDYSETFSLLWPAATTAITPYLPAGTSCTVTEIEAPTGHDALPNASYAWQAGPEPVTVRIPATEDAKVVKVTSDIKRVRATFRITKDIVNHTGHSAGGSHFSGSYRCDYNSGEDVKTGSWGITGQGTAASVDVLVGSICTVTEDTPGAPVDGDRSYTWSIQTPDPTAVGGDGATATVVNTLNRAEGSFNITKSVAGGTAGSAFPAGADFAFSYVCTPLTGDPISGSLSLNAGDSKAPAETIPGGSTCTVTEGDFPGTLDPFRWDGLDLSVSGAASSGSQDGRSITFTTPDTDGAVVSVRAVNSISAKTASVRVTKTVSGETDGFTGGGDAIFPVTLTCSGAGAQGTKLVAADGSVTWDDIPLGATCSASEGSTESGLRDGSYAWTEPTISDPVKLTDAGAGYQIDIKNPITRVYAGISVAKIVDDGGFAGIADPDHEFTGTWSCTYRDAPAVTGTWSATGSAAGTPATLTGDHDHVLVGSKCSVTEDTLGRPSSDPSYRWDATPKLDGVTVAGGEANLMTVTNKLLRDTGKVTVTKRLTGQTDGYAPSGGFDGFSVTARCYLGDPDESGRLEATVAVRPGDTVTVLDGVPYGRTCQVSEGPFPSPSQLRDASYAWDSQSVSFPGGGDTTTLSATNDSPRATVTNSIRRVTGRLAITKAYGDGTAEAVRPGTTFSGTYRCTYGSDSYTGNWTVTGAGEATLTGDADIPFTAECSATEDDPSDSVLVDGSYTWAEPDTGGTVEIASAAEPAHLVVTNTATRHWSGLRVTKTYDGPSGAFADDLKVSGTWQCTYRGDVVASGGWVLSAGGGSQVFARPDDAAIPAESRCTVTENTLSADQLTDNSYAWQPVDYAPSGGVVVTTANETASVTVANAVTRVKESFTIAKELRLGTGVERSALEANLTFSGTYRCTHPGDKPVTGTWGPVAADAEWTSPAVLVGSQCQVSSEDDPSAPANGDDSYMWGTADLGQAVTVEPAGQPRAAITVGNPVYRVTGSFGVAKEVTGDTEGISPEAQYDFSWSCTAANGDTFPAGGGPARFRLAAGDTFDAPDGVPVGSTCHVTEDVPPNPSDPSYAWSTELDVVNATGTTERRRISFKLPRDGAPVMVTATNTLTRTKGSFTVRKASDPADGSTVLPGQEIHYTVTVEGEPVGFTKDVVVTDALVGVLNHAEVSDIRTSQGSAVLDGTDLVWTVGTVKAGERLELTYTATVDADAAGINLQNTVTATGETPPSACGDACRTEHHTPSWTLSKSSTPDSGTIVEPGDVITYTLVATNTSSAQIIGATAVDDLSGLADAEVGFSSSQLSLSGEQLTWRIPTLAKGERATVSYTATVRNGADGVTLRNSVTPHGAGATCLGACRTTQSTVRWSLSKTSDPGSGSVVAPGSTITYTLSATNTGPVAIPGATVHDDISDLVDDATLGELPSGLRRAGDRLTWDVPALAAGASAAVSYTATVDAGARGATLTNAATPASVGGHCEGSCTTTQTTPAWSLAKSSTARDGATVKPGDVIGYTLTVANDGPAILRGAVVTDNLADVLDDATLAGVPAGASLTGDTLRWAVPDVAPGATTTLDYAVTVNAGADGATLRNAASAETVGGACTACTTTQYTPKWTLAKTSDPASGAVVEPGDAITYTLTATNTGPGVVSGATAVDNLAGVLANADVTVTSSGLSLDGSTLTWAIPTLLPGEHASVEYTARLKPGTTGVTVTNTVVPNGPGGSCLDGCATTQSTAKWALTKTSTPASGALVKPGDVLSYTLTVVNSGPVPLTGARVSDDISGLIDDATLGDLPAGLTRSGDDLTWTLPRVEPAGVVSVTYLATVDADALGAAITNTAVPVGPGGYCAIACSTTAYTDSWTLAKTSAVGDGATVAPGQPIGYALIVTNTGVTTLRGAIVRDNLADVLDDATLGDLPDGATLDGTTLVWAVPELAAGATTTLGYTATVHADATGARLRNVATPGSTGGACAPDACTTTAYTGAWTLTKSSDPASGVAEPGDTITYTLTATNNSEATIAGATAVDDLADVVDDADLTADSPQLRLEGSTLTWSIPTLRAGEHASVTYTANLRGDAHGATLTNTARPNGVGGTCGASCSTTHTTPRWTLSKTSSPASGEVVAPGQVVGYTLSVTNTGPAVLTGAAVTDDVSGLVDDADLASLPAGLRRAGNTLTWAVPDVPVGATASVTYWATVKDEARGSTLANVAAPASTGGSCAADACRTTGYTPSWTLAKSSDPASGTTVHPGDELGYTLTVTNTGPAPLRGARVVDDLSDVLDDATLLAVPDGATLSGSELAWTVPDLAPAATTTLSYRVRLGEHADGRTLVNAAVPTGAGGECTGTCTTTHATPAWTLTKSSDPASGAVVAPGDTITYTLSATNTGTVPVSGASATDDLTGILAGAEVSIASSQLTRTGGTLTWAIPDLAPGQTRTVTYSAAVTADGATLINTATPNGQGGSCGAGCSTTQRSAAWTLTKTSDPAPGAVLEPGDPITYTLTVANTGPVDVRGARVSDDVTDLVDDAVLGVLPDGLDRTGATLTWNVPVVPLGESVSISYSATVKPDALGATLRNVAAPASGGGTCGETCSTTQYTPAWSLAKSSSVGPGATVKPGDVVEYTLTVTNDGAAMLRGATVADDLSGVLDDATLAAVPADSAMSGDTLTWTVPDVAPGATAALVYRVIVDPDAVGATLRNTAEPTSVGGSCAAGACSTTAYTPAWTLAKSSEPASGAVVRPGDVITYTLTATNTSAAQIRGALALDDLSKVLPYADVTSGSEALTLSGTTLTWAIPTLAESESATVTYTARVKSGADGATVVNSVAPVGAGGSCVGGCATTQSTAAWSLTKSSDPAFGSVVKPGDVIHYTLTVANTGPVPVTGAVVSDDLTEVVDDAVVGDLGAGLSSSGPTLVWTVPEVPVGGVVSVGYTATVAAGAIGVTVANTASPVTPGGHCLVCTTVQTTSAWTLAKTSAPGEGATVVPGDVVDYTLTVRNTGPDTLRGAVVADDLADVLDDAVLDELPDGARLTDTTLTWTVPEIAAGGTASLTYSARVSPDAVGATLRNVAAPASAGGTCVADGCSTTAFTPAWTLAKTSSAPADAAVRPGDVITYTLTATNTSDAVVSGAKAVDDLSDVIDDAAVSATSGQLSRDGATLTWDIPTLPAHGRASVSYAAVVTADGATITNTVVPDGVGGSCTICSTTTHTPSWTLVKTSDPGSGSVVKPGDVIDYTLRVTNTGPVALTGALVSDDVADLVDDAALAGLPAGLTRDAGRLTWAVPEVPVGGTASITYSATVTAAGATLTNTAKPASNGGTCLSCTTTSYTPSWTLAKSSDRAAGATVVPGDVVGYTLTVTNTGPATLRGAVVRDDLFDVLDDASLGMLPAAASVTDRTLTWNVPDVAPGASVTLDYAATVNADRFGATLRNTASPASVGGACVAAGCATVQYTPSWTLAKSSSVADGAVLEPGDVITYTLTATNTSAAVVSGAKAVDDLGDVLDDATVAATSDRLGLAGGTLTWSIPTLAAGESASVSYTATVTAAGATIRNTVAPDGVGGTCTTCETTAYTPSWTLTKTSDRPDGAQVFPGDTIGYTLTVANTGPVPLTGALVRDDLSELVDDATLGDLPTGVIRDADMLTWTVPELPVGGTATIRYSATVTGLGARLTNTAAPASVGGRCTDCSTTAYTPSWTLAKTSDAASGTAVRPGAVLTYTLTVTNQGRSVLTDAHVSDDLADVLDDATLVAVPAGARLNGTTLDWAVPDVAVDGTATLTYRVTLNATATGATVRNVATPTTTGGECAAACETVAYTTAWRLTKTSDPGSGATVEPGDRVTYTLAVTNTGPVALAGAVVVDDMSGLLDDADLTGDLPERTRLSGSTLTWSVPEVPVGGGATISYSVVVKSGAYGVTLGNVATGEGAESCRPGGITPFALNATTDCQTRHFSPAWTLEKTSDPVTGSVVEPGTPITFTLRVRNTSAAVVAHAVVTDDLAQLLKFAALDALPPGATLTGSVITWTVPVLQPGEEAVLTYTVIVDSDAYNASFVSPAAPGPGGSCPVTCSTEHSTLPAVVDPVDDNDDPPAKTPTSGTGTLAYTGAELGALSAGLVLLAAGTGILVVTRRRRPEAE